MKNEKNKIHWLAYIILLVFIGLIVLSVMLTRKTPEKILEAKQKQELIVMANPGKDQQYTQELYDVNQHFKEMQIKKEDINITTIDKVSKKIDKKGLVITILGGYYTPSYAKKVGTFISELKDHKLYKDGKIRKVDLLMQEKVNEDINDYNKLFEEKGANPYNYLGKYDNFIPLFMVFYNGKALDVRFRSKSDGFSDVSYESLRYLNEVEKIINE